MPITTIGNSPLLQRYANVAVSPELADFLAQQQMDANMMGRDAFGGVPVPQAGESLLDFLANLTFSGQSQWAADLGEMNGIPQSDLTALMQQVNDATQQGTSFLSGDFFKTLADSYVHNPLLGVATGLAAAGLGSAAAAGGGSAAGAGGGFGGSLGGTTGAAFDELGNVLVTGAPSTLGLGAGLGAGFGAGLGGPAAATLYGSGSPFDTQPGPADLTVYPPAPPITPSSLLGAGVAAPAGLGTINNVGIPQGEQGPPEPTGHNMPDWLRALVGGGGAGGAGLENLGAILGLTGLVGSAVRGTPDQTSSSTAAPPAYLAPYYQQAAGDAQTLYGQGNYVAPVQQAGIDYTKNVLNGSYLNSNPWLDATFNKAAGAVTNQVQSNFGRSGRDARGVDAAGFAGDLYGNLATQIYGGNYQAERDRMQQLVPQVNQLGAVTNPSQALDDYIARLRNLSGSYGTSSSITPTSSNWWSGLAGLGLALAGGG